MKQLWPARDRRESCEIEQIVRLLSARRVQRKFFRASITPVV